MNSFDNLDSGNLNSYKDDTGFAESEIGGKRFASISLAGRKFTLVSVKGDETPLIEKTTIKGKVHEIPYSEIEVNIVGATPKITRAYYEKAYSPGKKMMPDCYSNDGGYPSKRVLNPKSKTCQSCEKAASGSKIVDGRAMIACGIKKRLVVALNSDFETPYLLTLASGSKMNFDEFIRNKSKSKIASLPMPFLKTKISMLDTDQNGNPITYSRLGFSPLHVEKDEKIVAEIRRFGKDGDKFTIVQDMLGLNEDEAPPAEPRYNVAANDEETLVLPESKVQAPKQVSPSSGIAADIADFDADEIPF